METLEDIAAATRIISGTPIGVPRSKQEENFDVNKADDGSVAAEVELECGSGDREKEKIGVENLSSVSNVSTNVLLNGIDMGVSVNASSDGTIASDEKIKDGEGSRADIPEGNFGDFKQSSVNGDGKGEVNGEKSVNQDNNFCVGDFVWGKIKSHPWWPGQIYDAKDASEFAVKHKQEGRILVAFFGDGSCSWCLPSQLIPFVENFEEMSMDSSSKSFLNAVQRAVDEVGRVMELNMTCNCIPEEKKEGLARKIVVNAGLKPGVIMPKVDVNRLSIAKYEPVELVAKVRDFAKGVSVGRVLELAVIRSWLSAFYRYNGGYDLPQYHEPIHIEGLEDENNNNNVSDVSNDCSGSIEVSNVGPMVEDWAPSAVDTDVKVFYRRKQKSVAELMGESSIVQPESRKSKKRKAEISESFEIANEEPKENEVSDAEVASDEGKDELEVSTPRERKRSKYLSPPYTNLAWWAGNSNSKMKSEIETGSVKVTKTARLGKHATEGNGDVFAFQSDEEKRPNGQVAVENDMKLSFSKSDVDIPVHELLSDIQSAALDHFYLSKKGSLDMVWEFVSAFRSSIYLHGPDYKIYRKCKMGEKRKSLPSKLGNEIAQKMVKLSELETPKAEERALPCLILSFTPEFPLPSKDDIMGLFGKFGVVNKKKTKVVKDSHSVKIVYMKDSDAETAFRSSLIESPFGFENVNYKLKRSSSGSRSRLSRPNAFSPLKQKPEDDLILDVGVVRRKLEIMTAILENYHSKFSAEEKCSLKDEMKRLVEKVEMTCDKVRVMAESTKS